MLTQAEQEALLRKGAEAELLELEEKAGRLRQLLAGGPHIAGRENGAAPPVERKRRKLSAAARQAISRAQKRRWAAQRAAAK